MGVVAIDLDRHLLAELLPAGAAVIALGAALIMMHHDTLADPRFPRSDRGTDRDHDAAGLVPRDHRPVTHRNAAALGLIGRAAVLVQIAAAHARGLHFDHDIVGLGGRIGEL